MDFINAVEDNDTELVRELLEKGRDVNYKDTKN